ncbi:hypothetical protein MTP99_010554 [Tenebrio molitor]|jgi:hypothetical protein|uniref:natterin-3-like n=1 Tax=Tenebrio molitor TaxID=7067 RepID=UPI001C3AA3B0|nr:hypothetical protein MTP99_010554 [Tenebrio molitor]CAH1369060.1 unnamed protein product [Tenebrio molitor]
MSGYEWVHCDNFRIPHNALKCGQDLDRSDIYIGLSSYMGDELPCKVIPARREAYVSHSEKEIKVNQFKILVEKKPSWVYDENGRVPQGAVPAGRTVSGETLYVGRKIVNNVTYVGKVHPSHRCMYAPYDGKEEAFRQYEVLAFK